MNAKLLHAMFLMKDEVDSIINFMQHNDPDGTYDKFDMAEHAGEYIDILEQWIEDADVDSDDPLYKRLDGYIDTLFVFFAIAIGADFEDTNSATRKDNHTKYDIYPCDMDTFGECPFAVKDCAHCAGWNEEDVDSKIALEEELEAMYEEENK